MFGPLKAVFQGYEFKDDVYIQSMVYNWLQNLNKSFFFWSGAEISQLV